MEQVTELVPVPEEVQLPLPNSSEEEVLCILPPHALTPGHQVGGQQCWTRRKADNTSGAGAARLFQSSTGIQGKAHTRPYFIGSCLSVWGAGSWHVRADQHPGPSEHCAPLPRFFND